MNAGLKESRRKLKDIAAAAGRGVHKPELLAAAREETARLTRLADAAAPGSIKPIRELIARYEALMNGLLP